MDILIRIGKIAANRFGKRSGDFRSRRVDARSAGGRHGCVEVLRRTGLVEGRIGEEFLNQVVPVLHAGVGNVVPLHQTAENRFGRLKRHVDTGFGFVNRKLVHGVRRKQVVVRPETAVRSGIAEDGVVVLVAAVRLLVCRHVGEQQLSIVADHGVQATQIESGLFRALKTEFSRIDDQQRIVRKARGVRNSFGSFRRIDRAVDDELAVGSERRRTVEVGHRRDAVLTPSKIGFGKDGLRRVRRGVAENGQVAGADHILAVQAFTRIGEDVFGSVFDRSRAAAGDKDQATAEIGSLRIKLARGGAIADHYL